MSRVDIRPRPQAGVAHVEGSAEEERGARRHSPKEAGSVFKSFSWGCSKKIRNEIFLLFTLKLNVIKMLYIFM